MAAMRPTETLATKLTYGVGAVAYGVKDAGFAYFLLLFYSQVLGVPAAGLPEAGSSAARKRKSNSRRRC